VRGMTPKLEIRNLSKRFPLTGAGRGSGGWLDVLSNITLYVGSREFTALLGPSGCGKSTLCNIVAGLIPPDSGEVRLDGRPLAGDRGRVAYMQQKDLLLPWRRVIDNAVLGLEVQGTPRAAARDDARDLLRRFGLERFEHAYPSLLSGGMRQRVALVRTLLCRKDLLVLDEPLGALDAMTRSAMHGHLRRLVEEFGRTILFITHDVEEAVLLADRIYVLSARPGRVRGEVGIRLPRPRRATDDQVVREKAGLLALLEEDLPEVVR